MLLESLAEVLGNRELGKGRQPFVELLAKYGGRGFEAQLVTALGEPGITGQAIEGLRIAGVPGQAGRVAEIIAGKCPAWIRREGRKYLTKFGDGVTS